MADLSWYYTYYDNGLRFSLTSEAVSWSWKLCADTSDKLIIASQSEGILNPFCCLFCLAGNFPFCFRRPYEQNFNKLDDTQSQNKSCRTITIIL